MHSTTATVEEQAEWGRGGMRRGHAQGRWELEELERELPEAPIKSSQGVAAAGKATPGLGLTAMEWAGVTPYPAENRVMPDLWV